MTQTPNLKLNFNHHLKASILDNIDSLITNTVEKIGESISDVDIKSWKQTLSNNYNQPHRHYHNCTHIKTMLSYFEQYKLQLENPTAVAWAIYYHDVIYDPTQADNEKQSAKLFHNTFGERLDKTLVDRVVFLIMLTEKHQLSDMQDMDAKLFLDMDLSILGQPWEVYETYANNIRKEYAHVPEIDYKQGRKAVLENFLQRPRLYFSDEFYQQYEVQARKNLQKEVADYLNK